MQVVRDALKQPRKPSGDTSGLLASGVEEKALAEALEVSVDRQWVDKPGRSTEAATQKRAGKGCPTVEDLARPWVKRRGNP